MAVPLDRGGMNTAQLNHEWRGGQMKSLLDAPESEKPISELGRLLDNPLDSRKSHGLLEQPAVIKKE